MYSSFVMIPEIEDPLKRNKYMLDAMKYTMEQGYFPLSKETHQVYQEMDEGKFIKQMMEICEVIYLFIDFGVSDLMSKVAKIAVREDIPVKYLKLMAAMPDKYDSNPEDILRDVSRKTGISVDEMKSKTRM